MRNILKFIPKIENHPFLMGLSKALSIDPTDSEENNKFNLQLFSESKTDEENIFEDWNAVRNDFNNALHTYEQQR